MNWPMKMGNLDLYTVQWRAWKRPDGSTVDQLANLVKDQKILLVEDIF